MTIDSSALSLLRCPETGSSLKPLEKSQLSWLNQSIRDQKLVNRIGQSVEMELEDALVNEERSWIYSVRSGIVSLIQDGAISFESLQKP